MSNTHHAEEELSLKLFVVFSKSFRAVADKIEEDIKKYGLHPTEFAVLELLYHKGDQQIQQIGKKVLLASGSITYVVDKLEQKNLLLRKPCPNDRRVTYAIITEEGKQLMSDIFPRHKQAIDHLFSSLSEQEKETIIPLLKKVGYAARG